MNLLKLRVSLGLALVWTGVPLGMYFNYILPALAWSPIFMGLSVLLISRYDQIISGRLPSFNVFFLFIALVQLLMLTYGVFSEQLTAQYLSFHLYILFLVFALSSNPRDEALDDTIIKWTFFLSAICSVLGAVYLWNGLIIGDEAWQLRQDNENYALEIFTASAAALTNLASVLFLSKEKHGRLKRLGYVFIIVDLYIVIFGKKRTPLIVLFAIVALYVFKNQKIRAIKVVPLIVALGIIVLGLYVGVDAFRARIDDASYNIWYGINNIFGNTEILDRTGSAIARYERRNWAYQYIENNFTLLNYVFGGGYMVRWLDNPLLQSYLDMGLLGFLSYVTIVIVYPVRLLIRKAKSNVVTLALSLCLYNVLSSINSGNPYLYYKYVPVVLLAYLVSKPRARPARRVVAQAGMPNG